MAIMINGHNKKKLNSHETEEMAGCNCRKKVDCPLDGQCLATNIVYQAKVVTLEEESKIYVGMAESDFKTRFNNHKLSINHKRYAK